MEVLPKIVRQRLRSGAKPGAHPQADLLTAFAETQLGDRERARVVEHLSRCEDCREVVFLSAPQPETVQVVGTIPTRAGWLSWAELRWGAAVVCVVVVGTAVTLHRQSLKRPDVGENAASDNAQRIAPSSAPMGTVATARNRNAPAEATVGAASPGKGADEDKSAARLTTAERPSPRAMSARPNLPMQFDRSRQINRNENGLAASAGPGPVSRLAAPPPALLAKAGGAEPRAEQESDQNKKQTLAEASRDTANVSSLNEMVTLEAEPSPAMKSANAGVASRKSAPESTVAGNGTAGASPQTKASPAPAGALTYGLARGEKMKMDSAATKPEARWRLAPGGALQRSWGGDNWESVSVGGKTIPLQALAALQAEVWVGGANGRLYHSADAGLHWAQVVPKSKGKSLAAGIIDIEFSDVQNGKVTTANGEIWTTSDAGQTWQQD